MALGLDVTLSKADNSQIEFGMRVAAEEHVVEAHQFLLGSSLVPNNSRMLWWNASTVFLMSPKQALS